MAERTPSGSITAVQLPCGSPVVGKLRYMKRQQVDILANSLHPPAFPMQGPDKNEYVFGLFEFNYQVIPT